jgi:hypothetical protein
MIQHPQFGKILVHNYYMLHAKKTVHEQGIHVLANQYNNNLIHVSM